MEDVSIKLTVSKSKNSASFYVQKTIRKSNGSVTTITVEKLGNLDDMNVAEIIHINKKRWEIEECFMIMKTEFKARPVYLQREDRIKAHFLTCFISLFIYRLLEKRLSEQNTCEDIVHTLRDMNMYRPGEKQGYIPSYTRTNLTDALHETADSAQTMRF